jgi:hypothetical protein
MAYEGDDYKVPNILMKFQAREIQGKALITKPI